MPLAHLTYAAGFAAAVIIVFFGPVICRWFEARSERLDRELWEATFGARPSPPYDWQADAGLDLDWSVAA